MLLKISYRVRAHEIARYDSVFSQRVVPLIQRHGLNLKGIWKCVVGNAGEYLELWEFDSMADFESRWGRLMQDPELQDIFQTTGPMVEDENFSLFEPLQVLD